MKRPSKVLQVQDVRSRFGDTRSVNQERNQQEVPQVPQ